MDTIKNSQKYSIFHNISIENTTYGMWVQTTFFKNLCNNIHFITTHLTYNCQSAIQQGTTAESTGMTVPTLTASQSGTCLSSHHSGDCTWKYCKCLQDSDEQYLKKCTAYRESWVWACISLRGGPGFDSQTPHCESVSLLLNTSQLYYVCWQTKRPKQKTNTHRVHSFISKRKLPYKLFTISPLHLTFVLHLKLHSKVYPAIFSNSSHFSASN